MRKIWYVLLVVGLSLMYAVFTSNHIRNVDNAWMWTAVLDHGNIVIDLFTLYIGSRVFTHVRTHEVCESEEKIGPLCVAVNCGWIIGIAIVIAQ